MVNYDTITLSASIPYVQFKPTGTGSLPIGWLDFYDSTPTRKWIVGTGIVGGTQDLELWNYGTGKINTNANICTSGNLSLDGRIYFAGNWVAQLSDNTHFQIGCIGVTNGIIIDTAGNTTIAGPALNLPYGFSIRQNVPSWGSYANLPVITQGWASGHGDYVLIQAAGNHANTSTCAFEVAGVGLKFGTGTNDGSPISSSLFSVDTAGNLTVTGFIADTAIGGHCVIAANTNSGYSEIIGADGAANLYLANVSGKAVYTNKNTLDDGSGNMTVSGKVTLSLPGSSGGIVIGGDINLYRDATVNCLNTDASCFSVAGGITANSEIKAQQSFIDLTAYSTGSGKVNYWDFFTDDYYNNPSVGARIKLNDYPSGNSGYTMMYGAFFMEPDVAPAVVCSHHLVIRKDLFMRGMVNSYEGMIVLQGGPDSYPGHAYCGWAPDKPNPAIILGGLTYTGDKILGIFRKNTLNEWVKANIKCGVVESDGYTNNDANWAVSSPSRSVNTNYTNNTGKAIVVSIGIGVTAAGMHYYDAQLQLEGSTVGNASNDYNIDTYHQLIVIVPNGKTYRLNCPNGGVSITNWKEYPL